MSRWRSLTPGRQAAVLAAAAAVLLLAGVGSATLSGRGGKGHGRAAPATTEQARTGQPGGGPSGIVSRVDGVTGSPGGATATATAGGATPTTVASVTVPVEVSAADSGRTYTASIGDQLVMTLAAASPGPWSAPSSSGPAVVATTAEVGADGTVTALFRAAAAGTAQVTATSTATPARTFTITVTVR